MERNTYIVIILAIFLLLLVEQQQNELFRSQIAELHTTKLRLANYFAEPRRFHLSIFGDFHPASVERQFNRVQSRGRVLIENWFVVSKRLYPIVQKYHFTVKYAGIIFRACAILTNIYLKFQSPMSVISEIRIL